MDLRKNPLLMALAIVITGMCLVAGIVSAAEAGADVPYPTLITQCRLEHGAANGCEAWVIPRHPRQGELREATAKHRYYVTDCRLIHGAAEQCEAWIVAPGGQIIAPRKGVR